VFTRKSLDDIERKTIFNCLWYKARARKTNYTCQSGFINILRNGGSRLKEIQDQFKPIYYEKIKLSNDLEYLGYLIFIDNVQPNGWRKANGQKSTIRGIKMEILSRSNLMIK
jgi:hypothetical protein